MTLPSIDFGGIDHEQIMFEQGLHPAYRALTMKVNGLRN